MRKRYMVGAALVLISAVLFVMNASFLAHPAGALTLLAHRGVHQDFPRSGLGMNDCTATRIAPPTHDFIENTLPSMRAAFAAGADRVEIDIHPTTDGDFAVFHDWGVDCRTNGHGVTREHTMAELRALDVGYGYTADGGRTFPLRGKGIGLMPSLRDVLAAFPDRNFLINFKSSDPHEAELVFTYLQATPGVNFEHLAFYGARPAEQLHALHPELRVLSRAGMMACAKDYILTGWFGHVGAPCRHSIIFAPVNYGWVAWGWPNRFLERMQRVDTEVIIVDAIRKGETPGVGGVDDAATFAQVPRGWRGGVATDRIELIGPLAERDARPGAQGAQ